MKRGGGRSPFDVFCRTAFDFLEESGLRHVVIGGLAVIAVGEPRTTADVDVVGFASHEEAQALIAKAKAKGFDLDEEVERERLAATGTLRFRRGSFQLDVILASLPFEEAAYARSSKKRLFGRLLNMPTPEDLILFKVLAGRAKDLLDAVGVAKRHLPHLNRVYLEHTIQEICDLAEDMGPWRRLADVLRQAAE